MATIIELADLTKVYGRGEGAFSALKGINLSINNGDSLAITGKSGSGKSTLLHLMALLDKPTTGSIKINGTDTTRLKRRRLDKVRNRQFGFVFQQFFLSPNESVLSNVILPLKIAGVSASERKKRGMQALSAVELTDKAKSKAVNLSGGQKQRVAIARAIINKPKIIFADEPTGNLDSATSANIEKLLFSLHQNEGITLIIVTHDTDLAKCCKRQVVLKDGLIIKQTGASQKS